MERTVQQRRQDEADGFGDVAMDGLADRLARAVAPRAEGSDPLREAERVSREAMRARLFRRMGELSYAQLGEVEAFINTLTDAPRSFNRYGRGVRGGTS